MKVGISVKIDVTKIDKARLFKGAKGIYLDLTTFVELDEKDQYDNSGFIAQSQTKEEREAGGAKPPILGNVRVFYKGESNEQRQQGYEQGMPAAKAAAGGDGWGDDGSDIPFAQFDRGMLV